MLREEQRGERRISSWTHVLRAEDAANRTGRAVVGRGDGVEARGYQMEILSYTSVPLFESDLAEMYREKKEMPM